MFTEDELSAMPEEVRAKVLQNVKTVKEVEEGFKKILLNPETRDEFEKINKKAGLNLNLPPDPIKPYLDPYNKKIETLETELLENKKDKARDALMKEMAKYGIPESEMGKIAEFQTEHGIANNAKAVELYAKTAMDREPDVVEFKNYHKFDTPPDEKTAYENAVKDIRNFRLSLTR